ncbi:SusC/RagA family TonB-linked outer membrane protein [Chitinophaga cymbidii]|uniref:SusC/RagA family TonB-linked outer membrane protein n=1 Tax=Chitinophaga cymbidii TaxID=1096750 RepID=A0A512RT52_9BACT|nr:TonB-dependent receptor [Chitinophaga cymbidii]GEP98880.1 SusC/RagA family TonB-linked outer membrane protein [Chitinophaga cymbidii]
MKKKSGNVGYMLRIAVLSIFIILSRNAFSQTNQITVKGRVLSDSSALVGVIVVVKSDVQQNTVTDEKGGFTIKAPADGVLIFSMIGFEREEVNINGRGTINVMMRMKDNGLNEVVVTAFGAKQKKSSMVSAITTINPKELKGPTSNLTTMLAGRLSGMISYQRSGEPGADNASFFIRGVTSFSTGGKKDPLILLDGMESTPNDLARLQPDDIAAFSILKDATATAVYGARGANGVVLVTTKTGAEGRTNFNFRAENSISGNTQNFKFTDNITYMRLANEAALTRDPLAATPYSQTKIDGTMKGDNPLLFPSNDWVDLMIKDHTVNQRYNLDVNGGGKIARFYISGTYNIDNGILKVAELNDFNSNIKQRNYSIRSNVNFQLTKTTEAIVRVYGQFDNYRGPVDGGTAIFNQVLWSNPVLFPAVYPQEFLPQVKHPLFGNRPRPGAQSNSVTGYYDAGSLYLNPFANAVRGYRDYTSSRTIAQLELKQDFGFLLPGLTARVMAYTNRYSDFAVTRAYSPFYYEANTMDYKTVTLARITEGTEYLGYAEGAKNVNSRTYMEAAVNYSQTFGKKHAVSGMLITLLNSYLDGNPGSNYPNVSESEKLQLSLPYRNQGISGRFTYGYDNRYLAEFNFGYNGSERFAEERRYGFFPSAGLAWNLSNEKFMEPLEAVLSRVRLRASYGLVGNDQIGSNRDRFYYLSEVNLNNGGRGATFGNLGGYSRPGVSISRYDNYDIGWEKAYTQNFGLEFTLFRDFNIIAEYWKRRQTNILMDRSYIPSTLGLESAIRANVGEAQARGVDLSLEYNKSFNNDIWLQLRGNMTYATSEFAKYEEPGYGPNEQHLSRIGYPISQVWGLIAERLFVDDIEAANSPYQNYGPYMGGDIKYRDVNGDGQITDNDRVPIGLPTDPEIIYGAGFSFGYKNFDISAFFQGAARTAFFINAENISPFVLNGGAQNGLLEVIANDHWSESNRNLYAMWPRLSETFINNNNQWSTWWMRDGTFLRCKNVEIGYNFSKELLQRTRIRNGRLYVNGTNLFVISKFKMWDPEMGGNGLGYPVQRVFNIGVRLSL